MNPQVGDIVQVKEKHWPTIGMHSGLVTQLIEWPPDARSVVDCVVFVTATFANPVQLQTRFVEVISRA
jgi:hypothetical protein